MAWLRSPWYPPASTPQNLINFGLNSWGFHFIDSRAIPTHMILEWPLKRYGFYGTKEDPKQDNDSGLLFHNFNLLENYGFISWFELNCLFSGLNMTLDPPCYYRYNIIYLRHVSSTFGLLYLKTCITMWNVLRYWLQKMSNYV